MEYWVDNSRENEDGSDIGIGSEKDPFNSIRMVEDLIIPLSKHTIHLIGTNRPYQGGLGGFGLKSWIFENCTIKLHETDKLKVVYVTCRTIPVAALDGTLAVKSDIFKNYKMNNRRFILDGNQLVLTRPVYLKGKVNEGFTLDKVLNKVTLDIAKLPTKTDLIIKSVTIEALNDISK